MFGRRVIKPLLSLTSRPIMRFASVEISEVPSRLDEFKEHLGNIEKPESMLKAAEIMAQYQGDQEVYQEKLQQLEEDLKMIREDNGQVVLLIDNMKQMQEEVENQIQENHRIEQRCTRDITNTKVYGVSSIAKSVIEIADHLRHALAGVNSSNASPNQKIQYEQLLYTQQQLTKLFGKYQINELYPVGQLFNPNQHESVGHVPTDDPAKANTVAEVQRSGFKIKDRLLRSATVVIYDHKEE